MRSALSATVVGFIVYVPFRSSLMRVETLDAQFNAPLGVHLGTVSQQYTEGDAYAPCAAMTYLTVRLVHAVTSRTPLVNYPSGERVSSPPCRTRLSAGARSRPGSRGCTRRITAARSIPGTSDRRGVVGACGGEAGADVALISPEINRGRSRSDRPLVVAF